MFKFLDTINSTFQIKDKLKSVRSKCNQRHQTINALIIYKIEEIALSRKVSLQIIPSKNQSFKQCHYTQRLWNCIIIKVVITKV
jgi:hypothetical protein